MQRTDIPLYRVYRDIESLRRDKKRPIGMGNRDENCTMVYPPQPASAGDEGVVALA